MVHLNDIACFILESPPVPWYHNHYTVLITLSAIGRGLNETCLLFQMICADIMRNFKRKQSAKASASRLGVNINEATTTFC